jgi:hypothetical protein
MMVRRVFREVNFRYFVSSLPWSVMEAAVLCQGFSILSKQERNVMALGRRGMRDVAMSGVF